MSTQVTASEWTSKCWSLSARRRARIASISASRHDESALRVFVFRRGGASAAGGGMAYGFGSVPCVAAGHGPGRVQRSSLCPGCLSTQEARNRSAFCSRQEGDQAGELRHAMKCM
jgi:hypothetical protein